MRKGSHHSPEAIEKLRQVRHTPEQVERLRHVRLGKHHTPETIEKNRQASLGKHHTPETKEKIRQVRLGKHHTPETKEKIGKANTRNWGISEYRHKVLKGLRSKKNRLERSVEAFLGQVFPGKFKFNGNGECGVFVDGGLRPDFVNFDGQGVLFDGCSRKLAIEVNGSYFHKDIEKAMIRKERFEKEGLPVFEIWDYDMKKRGNEFIKRLGAFMGQEPHPYFEERIAKNDPFHIDQT
jgi:very-short-patch-repair endonuclease